MAGWWSMVPKEIGRIALEMAPYIVLGLLAAAGVHALFPRSRIERFFGRRGLGSIMKAALAGVPLPLCSCAVVPTALSLKKRGASDGATVSFLVSTPETGIDSIAVTYALINPAMAVLRPLAAFVSAVISGLLVEGFSARTGNATSKTVESCGVCGEDDCEKNHSWAARLSASFRYVLNDFFPDIANWLVVGLIISGILAAVLPNDLLVGTGSLPQMAMTILIGVPLYICASASTPIAAILLSKGMTPGAALVFLLVGPATNAASLILIARLLGRWIAVLYLAGVVLSSVAIGLTANAALGHVDWTPRIADPELIEHLGIFHWLGLALLTAALIRVWQRQLDRWRNRRGPRAADAIA